MSTLLQLLLATRKQLGLTQDKMAKRLGISRNYLALIETGKRPVPSAVAEQLVTRDQQQVVTTTGVAVVREQGDLYMGDTPAALRARIKELEAELAKAHETIHNQSVAMANMGRSGPARLACGANSGNSHAERKAGA